MQTKKEKIKNDFKKDKKEGFYATIKPEILSEFKRLCKKYRLNVNLLTENYMKEVISTLKD